MTNKKSDGKIVFSILDDRINSEHVIQADKVAFISILTLCLMRFHSFCQQDGLLLHILGTLIRDLILHEAVTPRFVKTYQILVAPNQLLRHQPLFRS